ncbi:hypothetical protein ACLK1T_16025 [Escherichia coli]
MLFAALLAEEPVRSRTSETKDVDTSMKLLSQLRYEESNVMVVSIASDARDVNVFCALTIWLKPCVLLSGHWGGLVARFGQGQVSLPGSCPIGARPVNLHIFLASNELGATIKLEEGYVKASVDGRLKGAHIVMDKVSVGATVTVACVLQPWQGTTIIENAAR